MKCERSGSLKRSLSLITAKESAIPGSASRCAFYTPRPRLPPQKKSNFNSVNNIQNLFLVRYDHLTRPSYWFKIKGECLFLGDVESSIIARFRLVTSLWHERRRKEQNTLISGAWWTVPGLERKAKGNLFVFCHLKAAMFSFSANRFSFVLKNSNLISSRIEN